MSPHWSEGTLSVQPVGLSERGAMRNRTVKEVAERARLTRREPVMACCELQKYQRVIVVVKFVLLERYLSLKAGITETWRSQRTISRQKTKFLRREPNPTNIAHG